MSLEEKGNSPALEADQLIGTVVAVQANFYQVQVLPEYLRLLGDAALTKPFLLCTRRTRLKKIGQKVMVGDRVRVEEADWAGGRGAISEVLPRRTELTRPPIANADQILLVFAVAEPDLDLTALSRFLVKAESTELEVVLCLNKCDLVPIDKLRFWREVISEWGYKPFFISVFKALEYEIQNDLTWNINRNKNSLNFENNSSLYHQFKNKITILSGPSGVGKSSLINLLVPEVDIRVAAVSGKLGRGRHTTRHVELFELPMGGLLADSPGFNQPILECKPQQLASYFPEARKRLAEQSCQFSDCLHREEPNCSVRGDWKRYLDYLNFLEEVIARQEAIQQTPDAESSLKFKSKSGGKRQSEPKLESKKYRRSSRRLQHQMLQEIYEEEKEKLDEI